MMFRPCAIVPSRNHFCVIADVVRRLRAANLPVVVIDDASDEPARTALARLHAPEDGVTVYRLEQNQGKGGAVLYGFERAHACGFTHAVQVDADGQHDLAALPALLAAARSAPRALVMGMPIFDGTMPLARRIGRWITHVWVYIETLSPRVIDTMCGFRVYPLTPVRALLGQEPVGRRMDFDTEIAVRLIWRGTPTVQVPVRVTYPAGNTSNFDALRDNWRITKMHTRLVLAMPLRLPQILRNRARRAPTHWAGLAERGMAWGLRLAAAVYRRLGQRACEAALLPVVFYFHLTGVEQRQASRLFLRRAFAARGQRHEPGWGDSFRHFRDFARKSVETFGAWVGAAGTRHVEVMSPDEVARADGRGAVLIVSHLGNAELARALLDGERRSRVVLLVHTRHAENYNRVLRRFSPAAAVNTVQVDEIGPDTIIVLKDLVDRGHWIAIAGDRTPVRARGRVSFARFLGHEAPFPQGPYVLAHLLGCPVYLMFCLREDGRHRLYFEKFSDRIALPPRNKEAAIEMLAARYVQRLEAFCLKDPYQWYNFYDFWAPAPIPVPPR